MSAFQREILIRFGHCDGPLQCLLHLPGRSVVRLRGCDVPVHGRDSRRLPSPAIGVRALADSDWLEATRARLGQDAARLDLLLQNAGWRIIGGTPLFRLAARADARAAFEQLLAAGILARPFADAPDRVRFGIPADETAWERLATALRG